MLHRTAANRAAYNERGNAFVLIGSEDSGVTFSALILVDGVSTVVYFHVLNLFHELVVSLDDLCACHFLSEKIMKVITMIANRPIITTATIADAQSGAETIHHGQEIIPKSFRMAATADKRIRIAATMLSYFFEIDFFILESI